MQRLSTLAPRPSSTSTRTSPWKPPANTQQSTSKTNPRPIKRTATSIQSRTICMFKPLTSTTSTLLMMFSRSNRNLRICKENLLVWMMNMPRCRASRHNCTRSQSVSNSTIRLCSSLLPRTKTPSPQVSKAPICYRLLKRIKSSWPIFTVCIRICS